MTCTILLYGDHVHVILHREHQQLVLLALVLTVAHRALNFMQLRRGTCAVHVISS